MLRSRVAPALVVSGTLSVTDQSICSDPCLRLLVTARCTHISSHLEVCVAAGADSDTPALIPARQSPVLPMTSLMSEDLPPSQAALLTSFGLGHTPHTSKPFLPDFADPSDKGVAPSEDANHRDVDMVVDRTERLKLLLDAAKQGQKETVKRLLDHGTDVNGAKTSAMIEDGDDDQSLGMTALMYAAEEGHVEVVQLLLDRGANVNLADKEGWTPLVHAACGGNEPVAQHLLDRGADVNYVNAMAKGCGAQLHTAVKHDHTGVVRLLLDYGADVNAAVEGDRTPLMLAACGGNKEIVQLMLDRGANVNAMDKDGWTALMIAAYANKEVAQGLGEKIPWLYHQQVNAMAKDHGMAAADYDHTEIVRLLLDHGADVNPVSEAGYGLTPLMLAAVNKEKVQLMLDRGANVNAEASFSRLVTALDVAAEAGAKESVKLLLDSGANVSDWAMELAAHAHSSNSAKRADLLDICQSLLLAGAALPMGTRYVTSLLLATVNTRDDPMGGADIEVPDFIASEAGFFARPVTMTGIYPLDFSYSDYLEDCFCANGYCTAAFGEHAPHCWLIAQLLLLCSLSHYVLDSYAIWRITIRNTWLRWIRAMMTPITSYVKGSFIVIPRILQIHNNGLLNRMHFAEVEPRLYGCDCVRAVVEVKWALYGRTFSALLMADHLLHLCLYVAYALHTAYSSRNCANYEHGRTRSLALLGALAASALSHVWRGIRQYPRVMLRFWLETNAVEVCSWSCMLAIISWHVSVIARSSCTPLPQWLLIMIAMRVLLLLPPFMPLAAAWPAFGGFVRMVAEVLKDLGYFFIFISTAFGFLTVSLLVMKPLTNTTASGLADSARQTFLQQFSLIWGDNIFEYLSDELTSGSSTAAAVLSQLLVVLLLVFISIILLNLLIAIVNDSYDRIRSNEVYEMYRSRALLVLRAESYMSVKHRQELERLMLGPDDRGERRVLFVYKALQRGAQLPQNTAGDIETTGWRGRIAEVERRIHARLQQQAEGTAKDLKQQLEQHEAGMMKDFESRLQRQREALKQDMEVQRQGMLAEIRQVLAEVAVAGPRSGP